MSPEHQRACPVPVPPSGRRPMALAAGFALTGLAVLAFVLTGGWRVLQPAGRPAANASLRAATREVAAASTKLTPPALPQADTAAGPATSAPGTAVDGLSGAGAVAQPAAPAAAPAVSATPAGQTAATAKSLSGSGSDDSVQGVQGVIDGTHILASWEARFYPLYEIAMHTFGVNWLLIASIHKQETDFSTAPSTYHGLNSFGCCGGPMQFNVTNGPITTWQLASGAYRFAARPADYGHETAQHPSIYDDFDSMMAAAWLLSSNGAGMALDANAWRAAYDYYGHGTAGVAYADEVLARAIGWSQHGFCINCSVDPALVTAVQAAYGAGALAALNAQPPPQPARTSHPRRPAAGGVSGRSLPVGQPQAVIASAGRGRRAQRGPR